MSPKSRSMYSVPVSLVYSVGAMRISDHWNTHDGKTFRTNIPVRNGNWTAAIYMGNVWKVMASCPKSSTVWVTHENLIGENYKYP